jgi:hypothetical protein
MRCLSFAGQGNVRQPLPVVSTAIPRLDGSNSTRILVQIGSGRTLRVVRTITGS